MNSEEYNKLAAVEKEHWFYRGKRAIVRAWINRYLSIGLSDICFDIGAGTGIFVEEMKQRGQWLGIEPSVNALQLSGNAQQEHYMLSGAATDLPIASQTARVVTSLDVLEHIEDHRKAVEEIIRITKKDGFIFITVPACSFLMSDWDVSLGHFRRYNLKDFDVLLKGLPVKILQNRYINNVLFFPIAVYRVLRRILRCSNLGRLEDVIPPKSVNRLCYDTFVYPALWPWLKLPFGLSILLVLQKIED